MATSTPRLVESLRTSPVLRKKDYDYFVHPITDGIPQVEADLMREVIDAFVRRLPKTFDRILAPEAMGLPLATGLSLATGKPFTVARKRAYGLPGEIVVRQTTGYGSSTLHLVGLRRDERVVIVDDVLSTGGTIRALVEACRKAGATPEKILLAVNKDRDLDAIAREVECPIEALVRIRIEDGHVLVPED